MKILFVVGELGYRGTPRTLANYVRMLTDGCQVAVWGYGVGGDTAEELKRQGFQVFIGSDDELAALAFNPDVVNFHRPSVYSWRETQILSKFKKLGARCIETSVFGRVDKSVEKLIDCSIQISNWDYWRWRGWKGSSCGEAVMIPNPVNVNEYHRAPSSDIESFKRDLGVPITNAFVVGRIGKTSWRLLEEPLLKALNSHENLHVVLVGDYSGSVPEAIRDHPRTHLCARISGAEKLCAFYSACDVLVNMVKIGESFGFVNAEAMACETPVITLSTPFHDNAQLEMVGDRGAVLRRPSDLPKVLEKMIRDPLSLKQLGAACRESIVKRYSFEALRPKLKSVFAHVASGCVQKAALASPPTISREALYRAVAQKHGKWVAIFVQLFHTAYAYEFLLICKAFMRFVHATRR